MQKFTFSRFFLHSVIISNSAIFEFFTLWKLSKLHFWCITVGKNWQIVWSAHSEFMRLACHSTASSKIARRSHLKLVSLACVHPTASSKWAGRAHLELVSLARVHHCHICCPNPSSEYAWKCSKNSNKYWMANIYKTAISQPIVEKSTFWGHILFSNF